MFTHLLFLEFDLRSPTKMTLGRSWMEMFAPATIGASTTRKPPGPSLV